MRYFTYSLYTLFFFSFFVFATFSYATEAKQAPHLGELWTGELYTSTYKAGACLDPKGAIHGVLIVRLKNGEEDIYHFRGTRDIKGIIRLKHNDGHTFKGQFDNATSISGDIDLANGFSVSLKGTRQQNVPLGPHCRPL